MNWLRAYSPLCDTRQKQKNVFCKHVLICVCHSHSCPSGQTVIQHAISRHLPAVVEALCERGVKMDITDAEGNCPLWQALDSGQEDIAHTLVCCFSSA